MTNGRKCGIIMTMNEEQSIGGNLGLAPVDNYAEKSVISQRRKDQLELRLAGRKRGDIVEELAEKYDVSVASIDLDWANRHDWILSIAETTDIVSLVGAALGSFVLNQEDRRKILTEIDKLLEKKEITPTAAINMRARMRSDIDAADKTRLELLMKLGILREAPKKLEIDKREVKIEHKVDWPQIVGKMTEPARREFYDLIEGIDFEEVENV